MASSKGVAAFVDVLNASRRIGYPPGAVRGTISASGEVEVFVNLPPPGATPGDSFQPPANAARRSSLENYVEGDALTGTPASLAAAIARAYSPETLLRALPKNVLLEALRLHPEVDSPTSIAELDARRRPSSPVQPKPRRLPYAPASIVESSSDEEDEEDEDENDVDDLRRCGIPIDMSSWTEASRAPTTSGS